MLYHLSIKYREDRNLINKTEKFTIKYIVNYTHEFYPRLTGYMLIITAAAQ
jgi:hypothetical protein